MTKKKKSVASNCLVFLQCPFYGKDGEEREKKPLISTTTTAIILIYILAGYRFSTTKHKEFQTTRVIIINRRKIFNKMTAMNFFLFWKMIGL